jgi:hypothetical protein
MTTTRLGSVSLYCSISPFVGVSGNPGDLTSSVGLSEGVTGETLFVGNKVMPKPPDDVLAGCSKLVSISLGDALITFGGVISLLAMPSGTASATASGAASGTVASFLITVGGVCGVTGVTGDFVTVGGGGV